MTSTITPAPSSTPRSTLVGPAPATAAHRFAARRLGAPALSPWLAANWIRLCPLAALEVERGRAALVGEEQVALFLLADGDVRAVDNLDPYSGANVISRGIVGSRGRRPTITSPMHKQIFDLRSGVSVETRGKQVRRLRVWPVRILDEELYVLRGGAR